MGVVVDVDYGDQGEVLVSLQKVVALTHAGFSIASDASPWREKTFVVWGCFWLCLGFQQIALFGVLG